MNSNRENQRGKRRSPMRYIAFAALFIASAIGLAIGIGNPPGDATNNINIIGFPQRDFVSSNGFLASDRVVVKLIHSAFYGGGTTTTDDGTRLADGTSNSWIKPQPDPADLPGNFSGIVEVNHPGGACWKNQTPDIRPGDTVQIEVMADYADPDGDGNPLTGGRVGRIDETVIQNVTAKRPVQTAVDTIVIHGTAQNSAGVPLPVGSLEHRLVAPGQAFEANGKRTLRASSVAGANIQGTLVYDAGAGNINWTATYTGLSPTDVQTALGAESRGMWINTNPANALAGEITTYEIGGAIAPGPAAPCSAALESLPPPPGSELEPPTQPTNLTASVDNSNTVTLTWTASTDFQDADHTIPGAVTAYGIYRDGQNIFTLSKPDGSPYDPIDEPTITFIDRNTPPGSYKYTVKAFDEVGNGSIASSQSNEIVALHHVDEKNFETNLPARFHNPPELPTNIIAFPSRDFISPSGYIDGDTVTVELLRKGPDGKNIIVSSAEGIIPDAETFAEVNHPGARCWEGVTPDIRVGDIIRTIAYNDSVTDNADHIRSIDQTRVEGVTAHKPEIVQNESAPGNNDGIVTIKGTALGADGNPLPIDQIEQRMIARHGLGLFNFNGRRALRAANGGAGAGADGSLDYDTNNNPMGINWTATYSGLNAADISRILDADTRIHWLGRDPLLLNEATIFENAPDGNPPGPAGPGCTRPLEELDDTSPAQPPSLTAIVNANQDQVTLNWTQASAPQDDWYVAGYRIYDGSTDIANAGSTATTITIRDLKPGLHKFSIKAFDTASPGSGADPATDPVTYIINGLGNLYGNESSRTNLSIATNEDGSVITLEGGSGFNLSDVLPPSAPANLVATVRDAGALGAFIDLTWTASTDNVGVVKYVVHRGSSGSGPGADFDVPGPDANSYTDTLEGASSRDYHVSACDQAGHCTDSASITVQIPAEFDAVVPTWPATTTVTATNPDVHTRNVTVTWTAANDNLDSLARYDLYRASNAAPASITPGIVAPGVKIASIPAGAPLTYTELVPAGTYQYALIAIDTAGNPSVLSPVSSSLVVANDVPVAPHSLIPFPARDFISATGYDPTHAYYFAVVRGGNTVFKSDAQNPDATGLIEANHPATAPALPACWLVNTPNLIPGDVVRIIDNTTGVAEQTTIANVTVERPYQTAPGTVVVRGTAKQANGSPISIGELDQRFITRAGANAFDSGKRAMSTGAGDGVISYDAVSASNPDGTKWTATYTGLSANDVLRIVGGTNASGVFFPGAESRILWLGRAPLAGTELTIYENGTGVAGGPVGGTPPNACTAVLEGAVASASFTPLSNNFGPQAFNPPSTSAARTVTLSNGGTAPMTLTNIYFAGANPGDFIPGAPAGAPANPPCPTVFPATLAAGASCNLYVQFRPTALGLRQANLSFSDNAANTTDQTIALTGTGTDITAPVFTISTSAINFGGFIVGANSPAQTVTVTKTGGGQLSLSGVTVAGTNAGDFTKTGSCAAGSTLINNGNSCTVTLVFRPGAAGARTASVTVNHNAVPSGATSTSVVLDGAGLGSPTTTVAYGSNPVQFGTVTRGASKDQTISLRNSGQNTVVGLGNIRVSGTGYSLFSTTCTASLASGKSCNIVVRFSAPNVVNTFNGSVSVMAGNIVPTTTAASLTATTK